MTSMDERISRDERDGEVIINYFRFSLALIWVLGLVVISIVRHKNGFGYTPWRGHFGTSEYLVFSIILFFYLRKKELLSPYFKYVCVVLDMVFISTAIFITATYPNHSLPIGFLSIQALFYVLLVALGAFRYNVRCAIFSGIFAGILYAFVIIYHRTIIDIPYTALYKGQVHEVAFPLYNEVFRIMGMIMAGAVTGIACKRHIALFQNMIKSESEAAEAASRTVIQTKEIAGTIQKSTDEIFISSKDIFTTANNQAASVQEIESTINENAQIASYISEMTGSVATIATKMEDDVIQGFSVLESNVNKMGDIKEKNDAIIAGIINLGNKIAKIRDIVKTINTITDQTKVIAFNAALEAASAGDKGKRFAVVASEVNRLADDIAALTKQIRDQVEEIQDSSSSLIVSSEEGADKITEGYKLIRALEDVFKEIRSGAEITSNQAQTITVSTQKQQKSSEQINIAIADISKGLSNFIHSTEVATSSAEGLTQLIKELENILETKNTNHSAATAGTADTAVNDPVSV
ncbi:methyl-accepting chemotaxis protein [Treponema primitia]|uniref:methyl-accepting chemotaxis protein n=1 Tax=Treponema primitia TaxID=88058 RepID=UPI00025557F6|nr:methyl-accepting chemotaxis protein [Treponema primitia]